jgi:hypothetical protein
LPLNLQLSEAEGALAATKRQLDAARQEQGRLGSQLTAGLASASGGAAPAAAAAAEDVPARVQELTRKVEADFTSDQGRIAHVSLANCHGLCTTLVVMVRL